MKRAYAILIAFLVLPFISQAQTLPNLYAVLEKQKLQLPIEVNAGLLLTAIELEQNKKLVKRHYVSRLMDFGQLPADRAMRFTGGFTGELFEQCTSHQALIYDEDMEFQYFVRDGGGRLFLLVDINKRRCDEFKYFHGAYHG